jgi:hypothetical protein
MVGRGVHPHYRRGMNFLSPNNYRRWESHYIGNPLRAIVAERTTKYHPLVTSLLMNKKRSNSKKGA